MHLLTSFRAIFQLYPDLGLTLTWQCPFKGNFHYLKLRVYGGVHLGSEIAELISARYCSIYLSSLRGKKGSIKQLIYIKHITYLNNTPVLWKNAMKGKHFSSNFVQIT